MTYDRINKPSMMSSFSMFTWRRRGTMAAFVCVRTLKTTA